MTDKSALLIIDMQNDFVQPGAPACVAGAKASVSNIAKVLQKFRKTKLPVFHLVREYREDGSDIEAFRRKEFLNSARYVVPGTTGCEIIDELKPVTGEYRLVKNRFSGFMNTELDFMLRRLGVNRLVVTGTQLPNCIRATVFDAVSLGYEVLLITDASSAATNEIAQANIVDMANIGVQCQTTAEYDSTAD